MNDVCSVVDVRQAVAYERQLTRVEFDALNKALELKAVEYERRLDELNHAHARALEMQSKTVSREMYDMHCAEYDTFKVAMVRQMQQMQTRSSTWAAALAVLFTIITIAVAVFKYP